MHSPLAHALCNLDCYYIIFVCTLKQAKCVRNSYECHPRITADQTLLLMLYQVYICIMRIKMALKLIMSGAHAVCNLSPTLVGAVSDTISRVEVGSGKCAASTFSAR